MRNEFWASDLMQMKVAYDDNADIPVGGFGAAGPGRTAPADVDPANAPAQPGMLANGRQAVSGAMANARRAVVTANPYAAYGGGAAAGAGLGAGIGALTGHGDEVDENGNPVGGTRGRNALIGAALGGALGAGGIALARRGLMANPNGTGPVQGQGAPIMGAQSPAAA